MKRKRRFANRLQKLIPNFECGGCNLYFDTAYLLHDHMRDHVEGGSYFYNNTTLKAFPVSVKTDVATQTCQSDIDDTNTDIFGQLMQKIKNEESSDTDNCNDYDISNNTVHNEDNTGMNDANEIQYSNDTGLVPVTARQNLGYKGLMAKASRKSVNQNNKQTTRSDCRFKQAGVDIYHNSKLDKTNFKQNVHNFPDIKISLKRIDDILKSEKISSSEPASAKDDSFKNQHANDDRSVNSVKPSETKEKKVLRSHKRKRRPGINLDEKVHANSRKNPDPDYIPEGTKTGQDFDYIYDDTDSYEDDNDDPFWKKAKLECRDMKCGHCNKYIEDKFTKANLLALHNVPFRQDDDHIIIKTNKVLHQAGEFSIKLSTKKQITSYRKETVKCKDCGKMLSKHCIRKHMRKVHNAAKMVAGRPQKSKFYTCETCHKVLRTRSRKYHEKKHMETEVKSELEKAKAVCEICGKMCSTEVALVSHMRIHSIKNLSCKHCDHVASTLQERERHKKTHKFSHHCETCGIQVSSQKGLVCHIRRKHQNIKRFVCDVCGRQFYAIYNMKRHRATHFAPSFECTYCGRKFSDPESLRRHVMTHTGDVTYRCTICNHGFIQSTPYWMHMQKRHSISRQEAMAIHKQNNSQYEMLKVN